MTTHFLHIGKTGGTAIKHALTPYRERFHLVLHEHMTTLPHVPTGEGAFFFVRDPVGRFVSGFNSRRRCGRPRYDVPWTPGEQWAFARFDTPEALARALFSADAKEAETAARAMRSIGFVDGGSGQWLISPACLLSRLRDIRFIGLTRALATDFETLKRLLDLPFDCHLPDDAVDSHQAPAGSPVNLSTEAVNNLRRWYSVEFELYEFCMALRSYMGWG